MWRVSATAAEEQPSKLPQVMLVARHVDRPWQVYRLHVAEPALLQKMGPAAESAAFAVTAGYPGRQQPSGVSEMYYLGYDFRSEGIRLAD